MARDVNRKSAIRFSVLKPKTGSISLVTGLPIYFSFSSRKLHKIYQMSDKISSHISLMLSFTKLFIRRSNVANKESHILQDLTGFEI